MTVEFDQLRVIVVEDDVSQRQLAVRYLARLGVNTVVEAGDGAEALAKIRAAVVPFDIAICDLSMPGMDGVQFIRHMAGDHLVHAVLLLSGMASPLIATVESMARSHGLTVLGAIEKPVTEQKLDNYLVKFRPATHRHRRCCMTRSKAAWRPASSWLTTSPRSISTPSKYAASKPWHAGIIPRTVCSPRPLLSVRPSNQVRSMRSPGTCSGWRFVS